MKHRIANSSIIIIDSKDPAHKMTWDVRAKYDSLPAMMIDEIYFVVRQCSGRIDNLLSQLDYHDEIPDRL